MAYTSTQELSDLLGHPVQLLLNGNTIQSFNQDKLRVAIRHLKPEEKTVYGFSAAAQPVTGEQIYVGIVRAIITPQEYFESGGLILANTARPHKNQAIPESLVFFDAACIAGYNKLAPAPKNYHLRDRPVD